ncbi:MAG: anti-sigma F factor [Lachnospiraceae bacterium]
MKCNVNQKVDNEMYLEIKAISQNEGLARVCVAAFITPLNPTLEEIADVKTAVSEAVTNAIIHGYDGNEGIVYINAKLEKDLLLLEIKDEGQGIYDIEKAMEPLFTTKNELERAGMGFSFMEAFMDEVEVESEVGVGTKIYMKKKLGLLDWIV